MKESLEGAGIGLLGGLVIGISEADWLRLAIALSLIAYAGIALKENRTNPAGHSTRLAFTGFASFLAMLVGLYLNGQQVFKQTPKEAITLLTEAGYSPTQAREIYLKQIEWNKPEKDESAPTLKSIIDAYLAPAGTDSVPDLTDTTSNITDTLPSG